MSAPSGLVEGATETRRHYTTELFPDADPNFAFPGGHGKALCDPYTLVMDDARRLAWWRHHGLPVPPPIADLPLCKKCERKAGQR